MLSSAKYVGLDVHQATTVLSVRDGSGRVLARSVVATEEGALTGFLGSLRGNVSVALEEGTQAQWLYDLLEPVVDRVVVCDRRGKARRGNKGDQVDADEHSEALRAGALRPVYHRSPHQATLSELARAPTGAWWPMPRASCSASEPYSAPEASRPPVHAYTIPRPAPRGSTSYPRVGPASGPRCSMPNSTRSASSAPG